jgi:hypothetical protein
VDGINTFVLVHYGRGENGAQWDPYPYILLNLHALDDCRTASADHHDVAESRAEKRSARSLNRTSK